MIEKIKKILKIESLSFSPFIVRRYTKNKEFQFWYKGEMYIIAFRDFFKKEDRGRLFSIYKGNVWVDRIFKI